MPNSKRSFPVLISALSLTLAGCAGTGTTGGDVASVNGVKISRTDYLNKLEATSQAKGVLNQMVQSELVDQYAKDHDITVSEADVQKKEDEIKARYPSGQFDAILKQQNLTEEDVRHILRQQLIIEKSVGKDTHIAPSDVKAYLDKNHAMLDKPEQVRARHILVPDIKTAQDVETKLKAGEKFDALAKQYSTDPSSKDKGGELGFFSKGQMVPAFESAAFSQPLHVAGQPVKSPFGYHIIEVEEKKPPTIATMQNAGEQIKQTLTHQQEQTLIPTFLQDLRRKASINITDPLLKDALPPLPPEQPTAEATTAPAATTTSAATATPTTTATTVPTANPKATSSK